MKYILGCAVILVFGGLFIGVLVATLGLGGSGSGIVIPNQQPAGNFNAGSVTGKPTKPWRDLYEKAGRETGVPAPFLASVANTECGKAWSVDPDFVQNLIDTNGDVPLRDASSQASDAKVDEKLGNLLCGYDNGFKVWGPMQFLYATFFGYSRGSNASFHPANHPVPQPNAPGGKASQFTHHTPASIIAITDAVYAAALKLRVDAGRETSDSSPWTLLQIEKAACKYYGACGDATDPTYAKRTAANIEKFGGKFENGILIVSPIPE